MQNVLADLAIESEAATVLALRLARAFDQAGTHPQEAAFRRLATAVAKYWVCKRGPMVAAEALECLGGNGYVEESIMPRLYREAPLNSIWEGAGNVNALDVLRAMHREPGSVDAFFSELSHCKGSNQAFDQTEYSLQRMLRDREQAEPRARWLVERMAILLQASLLLRHAPAAVADAFCAARLGNAAGLAFGTLPTGADLVSIIIRATPSP